VNPIHDAFERQRAACADAGSPFYATILAACLADLDDDGPVARVMHEVDQEDPPPLLPLRFLGGVHRLVLSRQAPALALHYPSVGGDGDAHACWPAFRRCVAEHQERLRADLAHPPQTNDVGRSALLLGALHQLSASYGLPVRLFEIGSSAGLNLMVDRFAVDDADGRRVTGPSEAGVVLADAWHGRLPAITDVRIVERHGCDLSPVDISTVEGRERLTSFVWPDDTERFARLRASLAVAAIAPPVVEARDAVDFVSDMSVQNGAITVLWHSVVTMYMPKEHKVRLRSAVNDLLRASTPSAPFAHVWFEPRREDHVRFALRVQRTGAPDEHVIAYAPPHGLPVDWLAPSAST
jgi:hypothetical protein